MIMRVRKGSEGWFKAHTVVELIDTSISKIWVGLKICLKDQQSLKHSCMVVMNFMLQCFSRP